MSAYTTQKTNILGTRLNQVHSKVSWLQSPLHCSYLRISRHKSHTSPNSNHVHQRGKENIGARWVKGGGSPVDSDWDVGSAYKHGSGPLNIVIKVGREAVLGCKSTCMHEDGRWEEGSGRKEVGGRRWEEGSGGGVGVTFPEWQSEYSLWL